MSTIATIKVPQNAIATIPPCKVVVPNHVFAGWSTDSTATEPQFPMDEDGNTHAKFSQDTTLYAVWKKSSLLVRFDPQQGTVDVEQIAVKYGNSIPTLPHAERSGFYFLGWYSMPYGQGKELTTTTRITSSSTYYAYWEESRHLVSEDHVNDLVFSGQSTPNTFIDYRES